MLLRRAADKARVIAQYPARRATASTFEYAGEQLACLAHPYNATWRNERQLEIPIARGFLRRQTGRGLEVGNVLAHYQPVRHTVVDLYEHRRGVINEDILLYEDGLFDWIVAISTVEHIGQDEPVRDPAKAVAAVHRLRTMLAPDGVVLLTAPVGFNAGLDAAIRADSFAPVRETFYTRGAQHWGVRRREHAIAKPGPAHPLVSTLWVAELAR